MDETVALVRSVAVDPAQRLQAYGSQLVEAIRGWPWRLGVSEVFLLTQTASGYFARFGLHPIARADVSPAIQHAVE
jgi:amino-acid N-acetyltransferase